MPFPSPMHERKRENEVAHSCLTLSDPTDCSPPGSYIHGIFQARVLEWGAIAFSASDPVAAAAAKSLQSYPTLCDPVDSSPPGSPIPGILQARTLEWVALPSLPRILLGHKRVEINMRISLRATPVSPH